MAKVKAVRKFPYKGLVHDLTVRHKHSYNAEGMAVHNSAAGCLVSWCLGLTDCDPIEHGLLFERFLDEGRPDPPDIDTDFHPAIRQKVKDRIVEMFSVEKTCSIGTYSKYKTKASITDIAKVLGYDWMEAQTVTKEMESLKSFENTDGDEEIVDKMSFDELENHYPLLKEYFEKYPDVKVHAEIIRNQVKNMGKHAGGVIISDMDLRGKIPVQLESVSSGHIISSWAESGSSAELSEVGLVKYDILGLNNLPIIADCVRLVKENRGIEIKRSEIPLDESRVIRMETKTDLLGIFQLESPATKPIIKAVGVESLNDVSAVTSLLRPGPKDKGMHIEYAERKNGKPYKVIPCLEWIFKDTYGVLCIHEDVCVSMANGRHLPIKSVRKGDEVLSYGNDGRIRSDICDGCGPTRDGDGVKITLDTGHEVTLTQDHEIQTSQGMREVGSLEEGDLVAVGYNCKVESNLEIGCEFGDDISVAYLLGMMTGDAQISNSVAIACGAERNCDVLNDWIFSNIKNIETRKFFHCRSWYLAVSSNLLLNKNGHGNRKTKWHFFLEELNMKKTCYFKRIPEILFECSDKEKWAFLAGLVDSDGCLVDNDDNCAYCFITSVSHGLLSDIAHLLSGFGIAYYIRKNRVHIHGNRFAKSISPYLVIKETNPDKWSNGESIGWWPVDDIRKEVEDSGLSARAYARQGGLNRGVLRRDVCNPGTAKKWGVDTGDIIYGKLTKTEKVENSKFYGISVRGNHNLLANEIVVSNCYQEQMMQISKELCGFDGPMANKLRKACGKKLVELMASIKQKFIEGAKPKVDAGEVTSEEVIDLWDLIVSFARYGFNKSVDKDTKVITSDGVRRIKDVCPGQKVWCFNGESFELTEVVALHNHGVLPAYEVTFDDGSVETCTINHKFLTKEGQRPLRDILEFNLGVYANAEKNIVQSNPKGVVVRRVLSARLVGTRQMLDLEVRHESHNFLLASGLITSNSHAVTYSMITTAELWLKHNYFLEYMTSLVLNTKRGTEKHGSSNIMVRYLNHSRKKGIEVFPPSVNAPVAGFHIEDSRAIRFGVAHVKNIASASVHIAKIASKQPFTGIIDFFERCVYQTPVKTGKKAGSMRETRPNNKVVESLIYAGAFDEFGDRSEMFAEYNIARLGIPCPTDDEILEEREKVMKKGTTSCPGVNDPTADFGGIKSVGAVGEHITSIATERPFESMKDFYDRCVFETEVKSGKNIGQIKETRPTKKVVESLIYAGGFAEFGDVRALMREYHLAKNKTELVRLSDDELETREIELIGMCLSKEPICHRYATLMREHHWRSLGQHEVADKVKVFGRVMSIEPRNSKAGNQMYIVRMNDGLDSLEFFVFKGGMEYFRDSVKKSQLAAIPLDKFKDSFTRFFNDRGEISIVEEE